MNRIRSGAVVFVVLGLAVNAQAQVKYNRKTKEIKVEQTERTKKLEKKEDKKEDKGDEKKKY